VSNNTAEGGSGGGVLVNGSVKPGPGKSRSDPTAEEYGFIMTAGSISGNRSTGSVSPHGGGGIYVAHGFFEMWGGEISGNYSKRQGGGVFVWHNARFRASGYSKFLNNTGVGSSTDICSRGYTVMQGHTLADRIYIWNNNGTPEFAEPDEFFIGEFARVNTGIVLAYDDTPANPRTRNRITVYNPDSGVPTPSDLIGNIDLEGHLTDGSFKTMDLEPDWLNVDLVEEGAYIITPGEGVKRFSLGTFVGSGSKTLGSSYKLNDDGKMVRQ
jgi:hypothetical protein